MPLLGKHIAGRRLINLTFVFRLISMIINRKLQVKKHNNSKIHNFWVVLWVGKIVHKYKKAIFLIIMRSFINLA